MRHLLLTSTSVAVALGCGSSKPTDVRSGASAHETRAPVASVTPVAPVAPAGQSCGTRGASPCPAPLYCSYGPGDDCGATDKPGQCAAKLEACTADYDPVCGCDGKTHSNACAASMAGTSVKAKGACPK